MKVSAARWPGSRIARKDPREMLERIFNGELKQENLPLIYQAVAQLVASFGRKNQAAASIARFRELFLLASERTKLISTRAAVASYPRDVHNTFIGGLAAISTHNHGWLRPLSEWKVASNNPGRQFGSLVRHLFARRAGNPHVLRLRLVPAFTSDLVPSRRPG